jgi:hypothetical protein
VDIKLVYAAVRQGLLVLFQLLGLAQDAATTKQLNDVQLVGVNTELALINLTYGLDAAYVQRVDILSRLTVLQAYVAAIPTAPQLAANPVILPTTPPAGYGGGLASGDVASIWDYQYPPASGNIMGARLDQAGWAAYALGTVSSEKYPYADYIRYHFNYSDNINGPSAIGGPQIDPSTIEATDANVVAWLNRTDTGGYTWRYFGNLPISTSHTTTADEWWICDISDQRFRELQAAAVPSDRIPPIWPGLDKVTLGIPVPFTGSTDVNVPMHGILIELDTTTPGKPTYVFGSQTATAHIGGIAFQDDDLEMEASQQLSFNYQVYCPLTMAIAAGVKMRCVPGVTGIITPWLIT